MLKIKEKKYLDSNYNIGYTIFKMTDFVYIIKEMRDDNKLVNDLIFVINGIFSKYEFINKSFELDTAEADYYVMEIKNNFFK